MVLIELSIVLPIGLPIVLPIVLPIGHQIPIGLPIGYSSRARVLGRTLLVWLGGPGSWAGPFWFGLGARVLGRTGLYD